MHASPADQSSGLSPIFESPSRPAGATQPRLPDDWEAAASSKATATEGPQVPLSQEPPAAEACHICSPVQLLGYSRLQYSSPASAGSYCQQHTSLAPDAAPWAGTAWAAPGAKAQLAGVCVQNGTLYRMKGRRLLLQIPTASCCKSYVLQAHASSHSQQVSGSKVPQASRPRRAKGRRKPRDTNTAERRYSKGRELHSSGSTSSGLDASSQPPSSDAEPGLASGPATLNARALKRRLARKAARCCLSSVR